MENLRAIDLSKVMVIDIETVPGAEAYSELSPDWKALWDKKAAALSRGTELTPTDMYERAGIYSEFGKIICIGCGIFIPYNDHYKFKVKCFAGHDEKQVLSDFAALLNGRFHGNQFALAAHNGKEFDYPYLSRRMLINGVRLPMLLDIAGKKPWEVNLLDTMELWKFGDYKSYTSLNLLAAVFGIPTPKDDIDGSMVADVYYKEKNLDRISTYCGKDVLTTAQVLLKFRGERVIPEESVEWA